MVRVARFLLWVVGLELLWGVYVGTTQSTELIAGLIASVLDGPLRRGIASPRAARVHTAAACRATRVDDRAASVLRLLPRAWILVRDLAHGRRVRGQWLTVEYEEEEGRVGNFLRAMSAALENETPNAIVVDLEPWTRAAALARHAPRVRARGAVNAFLWAGTLLVVLELPLLRLRRARAAHRRARRGQAGAASSRCRSSCSRRASTARRTRSSASVAAVLTFAGSMVFVRFFEKEIDP